MMPQRAPAQAALPTCTRRRRALSPRRLPGWLAGALMLLSTALLPARLAAQQPGIWEADERVLIGDFAHVAALAADAWNVYAATPAGLIRYDPLRQRWELPLTVEDGYPARERPTALVALRGEGALVLGTAAGMLWRVDVEGRRFEPLTAVGAAVQRLAAGADGDIFALTASGWHRLQPGSSFAQPVPGEPAGVRAPQDPRLEALRARIGLDARMRRWAVTDIVAGGRTGEYFVGTAGGGVQRVDPLTHQVEPLPYGLASQGVNAIAVLGHTIWFAGDGAYRGGANIAAADTALAQWQWPGRAGDELPAGPISAALAHRSQLWFGSHDGLFVHDPGLGSWTRLDSRAGLPSERITVLHQSGSLLWIGTEQGACAWLGNACSGTVLPGLRIGALATCQGRLWLGTERGLYSAVAGEPPARVGLAGLSREPIQALACMADTLFAGTRDRLFLNRAGQWRGPLPLQARGTLRALAVTGSTLWLAMDGALARWDAVPGEWTYYIAPDDVPLTPIRAVLPTERHVWLGTSGGAIRLDVRRR